MDGTRMMPPRGDHIGADHSICSTSFSQVSAERTTAIEIVIPRGSSVEGCQHGKLAISPPPTSTPARARPKPRWRFRPTTAANRRHRSPHRYSARNDHPSWSRSRSRPHEHRSHTRCGLVLLGNRRRTMACGIKPSPWLYSSSTATKRAASRPFGQNPPATRLTLLLSQHPSLRPHLT